MGILIGEAVRKTAAAKGISIGPAASKLVRVCKRGKIRATWPGFYLGGSPPIPRHEFSGADIDVEKDALILSNGERKGNVYLDEADFEAWLTASSSPEPKAATKRASTQAKRNPCRKIAIEIWGPDGPPEHVTNSQIRKEIGERLKKLDPPPPHIDDRTILRAVGRAK